MQLRSVSYPRTYVCVQLDGTWNACVVALMCLRNASSELCHTCCSVLQCVAVCCSVCYSVLQSVAVSCSVLHHEMRQVIYGSVMPHSRGHHGTRCWTSHVIHANESCHTHECVTSQNRGRDTTDCTCCRNCLKKSCHTYE